eukprot:1458331-Prymnesium_polylepis.2
MVFGSSLAERNRGRGLTYVLSHRGRAQGCALCGSGTASLASRGRGVSCDPAPLRPCARRRSSRGTACRATALQQIKKAARVLGAVRLTPAGQLTARASRYCTRETRALARSLRNS